MKLTSHLSEPKAKPNERFKAGNYSYSDNNQVGSFHSAYVATLLKIFLTN